MKITISPNRAALSVLGVNDIVDGGDYREDGWIYVENRPIKKWHVVVNGVRVWEPKLSNLSRLFYLYQRALQKSQAKRKEIETVLAQIWERNHRCGNAAIAHARPVLLSAVTQEPGEWWWVYHVYHNDFGMQGFAFSFDWILKPQKIVNYDLGQKLYDLEMISNQLANRVFKIKKVFYEALRRTLPTPTANRVIGYQFGDLTFWFRTYRVPHSNLFDWEPFEDGYQLEIKRIV